MSLRYVISIILCFAGSRQDFLSGVGYFPLDVFPRTCPLRTIYPTHVSPALFCHFSAWIRWFSSDVARSIKLLTYLLTYLFISLPLSVCQCDRTADNMKQKSYTPHRPVIFCRLFCYSRIGDFCLFFRRGVMTVASLPYSF